MANLPVNEAILLFISMLVAVISFIVVVLVSSKCPAPELIAPCVCYDNTSEVHCTGNIAELQLSKLDPVFTWNALHIYRTNLTIIRWTSLGDTKWDRIYIHNNPVLRTLDSYAFRSGPNTILSIANCILISNEDVYAVVKRLTNTVNISLESNAINTTMPSHMFNEESRVKFFRIAHNTIRRLRSNTFTGAKHLELVQLNHNTISVIDPNGLDFSYGSSSSGMRNVSVILDDNDLTSSSFNKSTFSATVPNIKLMLSLKSNDLINISKDVFEPFLANGLNELHFD